MASVFNIDHSYYGKLAQLAGVSSMVLPHSICCRDLRFYPDNIPGSILSGSNHPGGKQFSAYSPFT